VPARDLREQPRRARNRQGFSRDVDRPVLCLVGAAVRRTASCLAGLLLVSVASNQAGRPGGLPLRILAGAGFLAAPLPGGERHRNPYRYRRPESLQTSVSASQTLCRVFRCLECPQKDSNLRTWLRRPVLYPLSYGGSVPQKGYQSATAVVTHARVVII
jgi:hypothetical protein